VGDIVHVARDRAGRRVQVSTSQRKRLATVLLLAFGLACFTALGCAKPSRGPAVPAEKTAVATIPDMPNVRYYLREDVERMVSDSKASMERAVADRAARGLTDDANRYFLAISGGSDKGAFGAGVLNGWTKTGTRPEFDVVTGVSTGSLIAPFAYLGAEYDQTIADVYTGISPDDIYEKRSIWAAVRSDAMADSAPLARLIEKYMTAELLAKIAAEYERGRWLMVVTSDLDSRRPAIWNMGEIAKVGTPEALALFRKVLLASASLPGLFPPVLFDVEVDGEPYQELHVDGGVMAQSFLFPPSFTAAVEEQGLMTKRERHVYLIRNAWLQADWAETPRSTLPIWARSNSALFTAGGIGDIYRIYSVAERYDMEFNLAVIPDDFHPEHPTEFDNGFMKALYDFGFEQAAGGYPWHKVPPSFESTLAHPRKADPAP